MLSVHDMTDGEGFYYINYGFNGDGVHGSVDSDGEGDGGAAAGGGGGERDISVDNGRHITATCLYRPDNLDPPHLPW